MKCYIPFFLLLCLLSLLSCSKYDDYLYEVIGLKANNANNPGEEPVAVSTDSIAARSYAIQLEFTMVYKGEGGDHIVGGESGYSNQYSLTSFNVYCLNSFDGQHPQGTSLNEYFLVSNKGNYSSNSTISSLIGKNTLGSGYYSDGAVVNDDPWISSDEYLILMKQPDTMGTYSFVIDIEQSNNKKMTDTVTVKLY